MTVTIAEPGTTLTPEQLRAIFALYDRGLYLQAYELGRAHAPLHLWRGTDARILAGRMAGNLGSQRLGDWHFIHAYRSDPTHPDACWYFANYLANRRGPLPAWRFMQKVGAMPDDAPLESRAHWLALHGTVLGRLRDFDAAEEWLARAEALGHIHPWVVLERAALYTLEDKSDEAEAMARKALEIRPWYRPAVQWVAHFLVEKERDDEALTLLEEAGRRLESCALWSQLAGLQLEMKRYADCRHSLAEFERLAPLLDKDMGQWLEARRSDVAYFLGEYDVALEHAKKVKGGFYEQIVKRLENPPADTRRVVLGVGFVRQHHQTCAPATLASLARFWNMPGDHLELAAAISYAGTPHHSERRWAQENGWVVREFTVTWDSAVSVLDRGLPFTLTTTEPASSHLQACIGYDARRGTLIIRDPSLRHQAEFQAAGLFERYKSTGPRGKVLVPKAEAHRLDGLTLPDVAHYDRLFELESALEKHDRHSAEQAYRAMEAEAANHPLTLHARRTLAHYDADPTKMLEAVERLLVHFPEDIYLLLSRAACLSQLARREEYVALLQKLAEKTPTDPICWQRHAYELGLDAREHTRAIYLLRKAIRWNPVSAGNYLNLAHIRWTQRRFDEAIELYHFAFCLEDKDENITRSYFAAARNLGKTEEALTILRKRFERFGKRSSHPARTLYSALAQLERLTEGFAVLDEAMALRPDDGDLVLYVAEACMLTGNFTRGEGLLQKAKGRSQPTIWLRSAANLASAQGDNAKARDLWAEVLKVEPLAEDAHRAYARLLADARGRPAALAHLQEACQRFTHNFALHKLTMEWLREDGPDAVEPILRRLVEIHPTDAWTRRELAWHLCDQSQLEEGEKELEIAGHLEPTAVSLHHLRGIFYLRQGKRALACEAFRRAIRTSVDYDYAIRDLLAASETHAERREAMRFVHQELMRQVTFGDGLLAFRDTAARVLEAEELLAILRDAIAARRDLWHAWAALVRQLVDMNQLDEAHTLAQQAVERFPLLPALWIDLARVCRRRDDPEGEIAALKHAVELSPNWSAALCELADAYERGGQLDLAQEVLERAIARAPLIANTHVDLAELLWRKGEQEQAFDRIRHAFELGPGSDQAWDRLCEWARKLERLELAVDAARQLAQRRPGEARSWLRLAQAYTRLQRYPDPQKEKQRQGDCLAAFDKAIALNPRNADFYDQKAIALAQVQRWDEAFAACRPAPWGEEPPLILRGRAAWLEAQQGRLDPAIERMRVVLQDDPKYYWGWSQLADWCQATGRWPDYLEAANQMCKLAPHTAQPLAYRGEARLRIGDRAGGMDDLHAALKLGPDNPVAAFLVFDEHLSAGSLDEAEKALAHLRQFIGGDYTTAREVQLRARQHRQDEAIAAFARLCRSREPATWPLDNAANVLAQAGWSAALKQTLREAVRAADGHPHTAVVWGQHYDPHGDRDLDDCLAALDKSFARSGDYAALDLKAQLLAMARRYDQALAVARAAADTPEFAIRARGRQAWIEKQRGRAEEAIDQMRQVVGDDPKYYWGWSQLGEWYQQQGRRQDYLTAAEHLVELAPTNAFAFAHRGAARRDLGDREHCKEDFVHAVNLAPGFEWVAFELFQMQFQDSEHDAAAETLKKIAGHIHPKEVARRQVQLAADMDDRQRAMEQIPILADGSPDRSYTLAQAADTFFGARWSSELADALSARLDLADPAIGTAWVRALCGVHYGRVHGTVKKRLKHGHVSNPCLIGICDGLIAAKKPDSVALVMKYGEKQLRADTLGWASMGRIFSKMHQERRAAAWMSDWAERDGVESWMLLNLAIAQRGLGWLDDARRVHRHALEQAKPDVTNAYHECWLMLDDALARRAEAVHDYFARGEPAGLDGYHYLIATFARALLVTITAPDKGYAFDEARHQLAQAARTIEPVDHDPALRKTYRRVVWQIAANCGGLQHRLWALWRMCRPLLPAVKAVG